MKPSLLFLAALAGIALAQRGAFNSLFNLSPGLDEILDAHNGTGSLDTRSLFGRQLQCPSTYPVRCANGRCCEAGSTCVSRIPGSGYLGPHTGVNNAQPTLVHRRLLSQCRPRLLPRSWRLLFRKPELPPRAPGMLSCWRPDLRRQLLLRGRRDMLQRRRHRMQEDPDLLRKRLLQRGHDLLSGHGMLQPGGYMLPGGM